MGRLDLPAFSKLENIRQAIADYVAVAADIPEDAGDRRILTIPRHNPVNAVTMGGIIRDAGLTLEEFKELV